eukprot:CAMPEP_0170553722 /NCGR_PEP_ID=MMETSP0211-20121228/11560_1 /TAXON_ID=311385 /ORGANISM="Pseudokeronopsis sp., Strain OXSARD2" /LENGTH=63 /DNA_ID=CAMNT_0010862253 /DNA_START=123 /DNA_END=314 /DNA_ORIENTATION=+
MQRPKSSAEGGRIAFKGRIMGLKQTDKDMSSKKGKKMLKLTQYNKESQESITLIQAKINALKR